MQQKYPITRTNESFNILLTKTKEIEEPIRKIKGGPWRRFGVYVENLEGNGKTVNSVEKQRG